MVPIAKAPIDGNQLLGRLVDQRDLRLAGLLAPSVGAATLPAQALLC